MHIRAIHRRHKGRYGSPRITQELRAQGWDNAVAESFFGTLEQELVDGEVFRDLRTARKAVGSYIHGCYNADRRHSTIGGVSLIDFEEQHGPRVEGCPRTSSVLSIVDMRLEGAPCSFACVGRSRVWHAPCFGPLYLYESTTGVVGGYMSWVWDSELDMLLSMTITGCDTLAAPASTAGGLWLVAFLAVRRRR